MMACNKTSAYHQHYYNSSAVDDLYQISSQPLQNSALIDLSVDCEKWQNDQVIHWDFNVY